MKLELDREEAEQALLQYANRMFVADTFNRVSVKSGYNSLTSVEFYRYDEAPEASLEIKSPPEAPSAGPDATDDPL